MNHAQYDQETGKPMDQSYLECGLPDDLQASIQEMQKSWAIIDSGSRDPHWDIYYCLALMFMAEERISFR